MIPQSIHWLLAATYLLQLVQGASSRSVKRNLIVDTDLFSDVEYTSTYHVAALPVGSVC